MKQIERDLTAMMDISNAIKNIQQFNEGYNLQSFSDDLKTVYATLHQLLIIGEASKRISADFKNEHKNVEWAKMAKMRDKLIHHYSNMDTIIVWDTIIHDLPKLQESIEKILAKY
jgi:uncharacterized protein with HEPN domain